MSFAVVAELCDCLNMCSTAQHFCTVHVNSGSAAEGIWQGVRLVVLGRDHVRVPCGVHAILRGGPRDHVPQDPELAKVFGDSRGDRRQRLRALHAVRGRGCRLGAVVVFCSLAIGASTTISDDFFFLQRRHGAFVHALRVCFAGRYYYSRQHGKNTRKGVTLCEIRCSSGSSLHDSEARNEILSNPQLLRWA